MRRFVAVLMSALALVFAFPSEARAADLALAWDAVSASDLSGYILEYGTSAAPFATRVYVGNQTTWTFTGLVDGTTYTFRVRAYNSEGVESDPSNEVTAMAGTASSPTATSTTTSTQSSCTTPDPFISMGGGTCYNGGWLPPGMAPPSGTTTTTTTSAPPPTTTTTSTAGCSTPDPFAAMGGGTCYNGGWLPPGMAPPAGATTTTTTTTTTTSAPPPTTTTTSTAGCSTPDPFAAMGGGTCYNGGWLPPGMAPPAGATTTTTTTTTTTSAPPPTTTPPPSQVGCTTPDPFAAMGGGTCYNGGWLPPGMAPPAGSTATTTYTSSAPAPAPSGPATCTTPDPFASIQGLVGVCVNGGWVPISGQDGTARLSDTGTWEIIGDDGITYVPVAPLDPSLDGVRVFFAGVVQGSVGGQTLMQILKITAL